MIILRYIGNNNPYFITTRSIFLLCYMIIAWRLFTLCGIDRGMKRGLRQPSLLSNRSRWPGPYRRPLLAVNAKLPKGSQLWMANAGSMPTKGKLCPPQVLSDDLSKVWGMVQIERDENSAYCVKARLHSMRYAIDYSWLFFCESFIDTLATNRRVPRSNRPQGSRFVPGSTRPPYAGQA